MVYLDYAATTPVNEEVLACFNKVCKEYIANANSSHSLGIKSNELVTGSTNIIANFLKVKPNEIIYTSGSTESNNTAIKGVVKAYPNRNKLIITTKLEHSSILEPLESLKKEGFLIEYINILEDGLIDLNHLKQLLKKEPLLVTISCVDSELGIRQPIEEIGKLIKEYPKTIFHSDITQAIGKLNFSLADVDMASFSAHKFYGLKGIGIIMKKENILLHPLIEGGKSTTIYRSGTPNLPMIASIAKAVKILKINDISYLNKIIIDKLIQYPQVKINSTKNSIPEIINFSILSVKGETFLHMLEKYGVYISTKTACSKSNDYSLAVFEVTKDKIRASSSLRISMSYLTTKEEIDKFLTIFDKCYQEMLV